MYLYLRKGVVWKKSVHIMWQVAQTLLIFDLWSLFDLLFLTLQESLRCCAGSRTFCKLTKLYNITQ